MGKIETASRPIIKPSIPQATTTSLSEVFCVYPFMHINIYIDGRITLCCRSNGTLRAAEADGRHLDMSIYTDTFASIWNSEAYRSIRRSFFERKQVSQCANCYEQDRVTGSSLRVMANKKLLPILTGKGCLEEAMNEVVERSHVNQFYEPQQLSYHLWVGSSCNMRCRMCSAEFSTSIQRDSIHSRWRPAKAWKPAQNRFGNMQWGASDVLFNEEIFPKGAKVWEVVFSGGEPLINKSVFNLVRRLASESRCENVDLTITTNGSVNPDPFTATLEGFRKVNFLVSADGCGALNEFIRFNSKWSHVSENIARFSGMKNATTSVCPTVSVYNLFGLEELVAFCHERKLGCLLENVLWDPLFLSIAALPRSIVDNAIEHWKAVRGLYSSEFVLRQIDGLLRRIGDDGRRHSRELFDSFVAFNRDINASHGTTVREANPRLYALLKRCEYGFAEESEKERRIELAAPQDEPHAPSPSVTPEPAPLVLSEFEKMGLRFSRDEKDILSLPAQNTVTVPASTNCLTVGAGLSIQVPCADYNGKLYKFILDFYRNPDDPSGYYWKMDMSTLSTGSGSKCIFVGTDLSMFLGCVTYNGTQYGFTLKFYPNPYDQSGLYWVMDKSTLVVK